MKFIVFDTETANDLECPLMYNIGWVVVDVQGNIYKREEYLCKEIFFGEKALMRDCYYAQNLPIFYDKIKKKTIQLGTLYDIKKALADCCKEFGVVCLVAHNAPFDYRSTTTTQRYITKSKYRYFLPYGVELWDTLRMANDVFSNDEDYVNFCVDNGFMTKHNVPRAQLTAEVIYRYLTQNVEFVEKHTALEDAEIEAQIFAYCMSLGKDIRKKAFGRG